MIKLTHFSLLFMLFNVSVWSKTSAQAQKTYDDIKQTLGSVPSFFKDFPEAGISGAWEDMKNIQLNEKSAIPGKYKELIGLAVSAQIPCRYCVYFHTQAALLNQAEQQELKESLAMAASVRRWSTILYGSQANLDEFRAEVDKLFKFAEKNKSKEAEEEAPMQSKDILTPQDAYKDMKNSLGLVPTFLKNYPQSGVVGVWKEMKGVEMNPETMIPGKYKELIGLAVAAQTPCPYCVYYHTKSAMFQGATSEEINEAIAMAGITREWSTVLNGQIRDEKNYQAEVDKVIKHLKTKSERVSTI